MRTLTTVILHLTLVEVLYLRETSDLILIANRFRYIGINLNHSLRYIIPIYQRLRHSLENRVQKLTVWKIINTKIHSRLNKSAQVHGLLLVRRE